MICGEDTISRVILVSPLSFLLLLVKCTKTQVIKDTDNFLVTVGDG
jgi:hypothetical protein